MLKASKLFLFVAIPLLTFLLGIIVSWHIYEQVSENCQEILEPKKSNLEIQIIEQSRGIASWYGRPYHGRRAADGSIYDMEEMTVASRTLPLGSLVMIENLKNNRRAIATVTDRGPYVDGRIIDVSLAVAEALGIVQEGIAPVEVRRLRLIEFEPKPRLSNGD